MRQKLIVCMCLLMITIILVGCDKNNYPYSSVLRDDYNTGGSLDFEYNDLSHIITVGGENQVIEYYDKDISKGWSEEGCRIGIKILKPKDIEDYQSGYAVIDNSKIFAKDFIKENANSQNVFAEFFPIVKEDTKEILIKIVWNDESVEQNYKIVIKQGTILEK